MIFTKLHLAFCVHSAFMVTKPPVDGKLLIRMLMSRFVTVNIGDDAAAVVGVDFRGRVVEVAALAFCFTLNRLAAGSRFVHCT